MKRAFYLFFWLLCFFSTGKVIGQIYKFKEFTTFDGLPQPYIYSILQDKRGFLWLATGDGLSKFDGFKFINYTTKEQLAENFVTKIFEDSRGNIWLGHNQGGISLSENQYKFRALNTQELTSSAVRDIQEDQYGNIWVASQRDGLLKIGKGFQIRSYKELFKNQIIECFSISSDYILVGTDEGLTKYDILGDSLAMSFKVEELDYVKITTLKEDLIKGEFWVGTEDEGLMKFKFSETNNAKQLFKDQRFLNTRDILIDRNKSIWVSLWGKGVSNIILNTSRTQVEEYLSFQKGNGLNNLYVEQLYKDRENYLWLGTYGGGLLQLVDNFFLTYQFSQDQISNTINTVSLSQNKKNLWVGSSKGLAYVTPETREFSTYQFFLNTDFDSEISNIYENSLEQLWISTVKDGVFLFDTASNTLNPIPLSTDPLSKESSIIVERNNSMWVGTKDGLFNLDYSGNLIKHYNTSNGLIHNNINTLYVGKNNNLYIGTPSNFLLWLDSSNTIQNFSFNNSSRLINIQSITEDKNGYLWLATYGSGIIKYDSLEVKNFSSREGLLSDYCYSISSDTLNNIWVGHRNGLSRVQVTDSTVHTYGRSQGVEYEFNKNASITTPKGDIWFGTDNGLLKYAPQQFNKKKLAPKLNLLSVNIGDIDISREQNFTLPYDIYEVEFDFIGVSFKETEKVTYRYKLEGHDLNWSSSTNISVANYRRIEDGQYVFKLIACNSDGECTEEPLTFTFQVSPPIWKQPWFLVGIILLGVLGIYLFVVYRTRQLQKEKTALDRQVRLRTAELEAAQEEVKSTNEELKALNVHLEDKVKERTEKLAKTNKELDTFIYSASHDLMSPIASIEGLTNLGLLESQGEQSQSQIYFESLNKEAKKMNRTLRKLTMISTAKTKEFELEPIDFPKIFQNVKQKLGVNLKEPPLQFFEIVYPSFQFTSDEEIIEMIFFCMIENAIMFRRSNQEGIPSLLKIEVSMKDDNLAILVEDNGIGIVPEYLGKIYDMFFRGSVISKGNGLGLYVVRKVLERLNGRIEVDSVVNKYTRFQIRIPETKVLYHKNTSEIDKEVAQFKGIIDN